MSAVTTASELLNPTDCAQLLGLRDQTLAVWRLRGFGPRFIKVGSRIKYRRSDVEIFLDQRTVASSGEAQQLDRAPVTNGRKRRPATAR